MAAVGHPCLWEIITLVICFLIVDLDNRHYITIVGLVFLSAAWIIRVYVASGAQRLGRYRYWQVVGLWDQWLWQIVIATCGRHQCIPPRLQ